MEILLQSVVVAMGASIGSVALAAVLALSTFGRQHFVARLQSTLVSSLILLPNYVVAGAWSAGFGSLGWWTLSQVSSAQGPLVGLASVVWIHTMAAVPLAYWLLLVGLRRCPRAAVELAALEGGVWNQLIRGILPTWSRWLVATTLFMAAWVSGDMVVSNLFQVTTLAEKSYLALISDRADGWAMAGACSLSIGLAMASYAIISQTTIRSFSERSPSSWNRTPLGQGYWGAGLGSAVVLVVTGIPFFNLVTKAGWVATTDESGTIHRSWLVAKAVQSVANAPHEFFEEFSWSISLSIWSSTIACALGLAIAVCGSGGWINRQPSPNARNANGFDVFFAVLLFVFALPGPIVNSLVMRSFQLSVPGLSWLNDHTLLAPILCLQFRLFPIAAFAAISLDRQWRRKVGDIWLLDAEKSAWSRLGVYARAMGKPLLVLWILLGAFAFGELSSYLLCLPPGVTPISMRIFDLLHYGVRSSEAGLLLLLALIGILFGHGLAQSLGRYDSPERFERIE